MADPYSTTNDDRKDVTIASEKEADMHTTHKATIEEAKAATEKEHSMTLLEGLRLYPKAVAWSLLISTCIAMEGFDLALVNGLYGFAQWRQKYGELQPDGSYEVSAAWQAGLSNGANVGSIIGLFINGWISERFGYRYTIISCLTLLMGFTTIFFTAQNVETLLVAEILCGIPVCTIYAPHPRLLLTCVIVGRFPDSYHHLRIRGLPCRSAWLPHYLCELLLGSRAADRRWSHQGNVWQTGRVGLPYSLRFAMDVACPPHHRNLLCTGKPMVARQKRKGGAGKEIFTPTYESRA